MICFKCNSIVEEAARFCSHCGTFVGQTCPTCRTAAAANAQFCQNCGTPLLTQRTAVGAAPRGAETPASVNISRQIAGERKRVTMLFADIASSTELLANLDAEEAKRLVEAVVERMIAAVNEFGGVVNQVSGDGIMALFGAPAALEDHALRACYAALRMQGVIKGQSFAQAPEHAVRIRVGIHSGEVVVAERGYGSDHQYTAFGRAAHLAARMEQSARPGHILISASTHALVATRIYAENMGMIPVKGFTQPVSAFELVGTLPDPRVPPNDGAGAPFIGRTALLKTLRELASNARSGHGEAVVISGEPGSGKSRICREVLKEIRLGFQILETGGISFIRATPYRSVVEWLQSCFADLAAGLDRSIPIWLEALGAAAPVHGPALLALFGRDKEDARWSALTPEMRRRRIEDAVIEVFHLEAARYPLALLIEDLQWVDDATISVLSALIPKIAKTRIFLIATVRSDGRPAALNSATTMVLDNFSEDETKEFLDIVLGASASLNKLKAQLFRQTAGNPFFLEETIKSLQASSALVGTKGAYALKEISNIEIPETVQDLLAMRIDRLPLPAKVALQAAAVLGAEFDPNHLTRLVGQGADQAAVLEQLCEANFLVRGVGPWQRHAAFRHALSREVAYAAMLYENRERLHARAIRIFEEEADTEPSILAFHARCGKVWEKAYQYSRSAGQLSFSRSALREALQFLEDALEAVSKLPANNDVRRAELGLRFEIRNTLLLLGRAWDIGEHLITAESLARQIGDNPGLARALYQRAHYAWLIGKWGDAIDTGTAALIICEQIGDLGLRFPTTFYMALASYALGDYAAGADLLARNVVTLSGDLALERFGSVSICSVVSGCYLSICLAELGRLDEAAKTAAGAQSVAREAGGPFDRIQADLAVAGVDLIRGDAEQKIPLLEEALALCRSASVAVLIPRTASALALAYALAGRVEEALELTPEREERSGEAVRAMSLLASGQALLVAGRVKEAVVRAKVLLEHCRTTNQPGAEAWGLYLLASAYAAQGLWLETDSLLRRSTALAKPRGMRPLLARCDLLQASVARALGDEQGAADLAKVAYGKHLSLGLKWAS